MPFLDRLKLNRKLMLLVLVPLLLVSYFSLTQTSQSWTLQGSAARLSELAALGTRVSALVHELQKERGNTAGFLGSRGEKFAPELARQRQSTDAKRAALDAFLATFDVTVYGDRLQSTLADVQAKLQQIVGRRTEVDRFELSLNDALAYYTGMNGAYLDLITEMSKVSPDETLAIMTAAYANFLQSKERAGIERAVLSNTFAQDRFAPGMYLRFLQLQTTQDNFLSVFASLANEGQKRFLRETVRGESVDETLRLRQLAMDRAETGGFDTDALHWFKVQTDKINLLKKVEDHLAADLESLAAAVGERANLGLVVNLAISSTGIVVTLLLGWVLARSILRQLGGEPRYIADIADHIAHGELDTPLDDEGSRKRTGIYASIVSMRDNLRRRIEADRRAAQETLRIKTALDCVGTGVMVVDAGNRVIYVNASVERMFDEAATDLRAVIPAFDAHDLLGRDVTTILADASGGRLPLDDSAGRETRVVSGGHTFGIVANPVTDAQGNSLGTALEWTDLSAQLAEAQRERERLVEERARAAENTRIRNALDNVSSCVVMVDNALDVAYLNKAAARLFSDRAEDFAADLPGFDANALVGQPVSRLYSDSVRQAQLLGSTQQHSESEVCYGASTLRVVSNPVFDGNGEQLGIAMEWADRTGEVAVEREIDAIVSAAGRGDLTRRIATDELRGFFRVLGGGINQLIGVVQSTMEDIAAVMQRLSSGDLTQPITRDYQGTYGQVKEGVNGTMTALERIVASLRESATVLSSAAGEISSGNGDLSQRTEQNAASLEETAASLEELTSTVRNNAANAEQADRTARAARQQAEHGGKVVGDAVRAMDDISRSSGRIAEIIGVIDEIAFQTNLLALNASVEAARAGDQGRGFAVVATEVRNLASRSADAAKEIKQLINDSVAKVAAGTELVNQSGSTLDGIIASVNQVADIVAEITAASTEQSAGIDQINHAVTRMDETTQQNAALAEQTSAAAISLDEKAREMWQLIEFFRTREGGQAAI